MRKILVNKIRCKKCGDIIESKSVHDFIFCKCESVAVDPVVKNVHMKTLCGDSISVPLETAVRREIIEGINDLY